MVEAAKDGTLLHLVGNAEECPQGTQRKGCSARGSDYAWIPLLTAVVPVAVSEVIGLAKRACFASSSTVQTPNGVININSLRLNDSVLTFTPGVGAHYTEVNSCNLPYKPMS